jgi:hypothetical protein
MVSHYGRRLTGYGSMVKAQAGITLILRAHGSAIHAVTYANAGRANDYLLILPDHGQQIMPTRNDWRWGMRSRAYYRTRTAIRALFWLTLASLIVFIACGVWWNGHGWDITFTQYK